MKFTASKTKRCGWLVLAVCLLVSFSPATWCAPEYRAITILHTGDTHSHLFPDREDRGGIARRATLVQEIRESVRGNAIFMDSGDTLDGTPFSLEYDGEADFAAMSAAGYDVMVVGNHEFSPTFEQFHQNLEIATFPKISANLIYGDTGELVLPPYVIYDIRDVKIAVFGLTIVSSEYRAARGGFAFLDPLETAKELVPELKKQADIIIALTHLGFGEDQRLAREVPGIDIIVGGHSHTRLAQPRFIPQSDEPHAFWIGGTLIAHAYEKGRELGRLDLRLRRNDGPFTLMSYEGNLLPITSEIPECPVTAEVVNRYYEPIAAYYGEVIGQASATFHDDRRNESAVLYLVCDAIREAAGTEIGIYGVGGIRAEIPEGPIKGWDVATVLPFRNKIMILEMTGERLKQGLERFSPGVSGMSYRMSGGRVVEAMIDGKPILGDAVYRIGTIDWLFDLFFDDVTVSEILDITSLTATIDYIKSRGTISPVLDGRRIIN